MRPNVVLVTVDSLRADHLGCYGYRRSTSPKIDRLARDSVVFTHAFSNGPNTPHAFPAIMSAQSSLASRRLGLFDAPATLAEIFSKVGYQTAAFNAANPYVSKYFHYNRGFDKFRDYLDFSISAPGTDHDQNIGGHRKKSSSAREFGQTISIPDLDINHYVISQESIRSKANLENRLNIEVLETIREFKGAPFFLWVHYMDSHYPYVPQAHFQTELGIEPILKEENLNLNTLVRENAPISPQQLRKVVDLYDAAVLQLDAKIGELLHQLGNSDLYDTTLVLVVADHGEEFLDHGDLQHKSKLFDELIRVPLLIKLAGKPRGSFRSELVSLLQLAPTIAELVGIDHAFAYPGMFRPVGLESPSGSPAVFSAASYGANGTTPVDRSMFHIDMLPKIFCCREHQWKFISDYGNSREYLFNLLADPHEERDLSGENPKRLGELRATLETHVRLLEKYCVTSQISRVRKKISCGTELANRNRPVHFP